MKELLVISRNFPPAGAVGVQRITKFVKYLPCFHWLPTVVTGLTGEYGLCDDPYLAGDVEKTEVLRSSVPDIYALAQRVKQRLSPVSSRPSRSRNYKPRGPCHPKSWIVPDSQILWAPLAVSTALRAAEKHRWRAVLATVGPYTNAIIAHWVAGILKIPYIIDYRDPLTNAFMSPRRPAFLGRFERGLEARIFSGAGAVTMLSPVCVKVPLESSLPPPPLHLIENGYDEADYTNLSPRVLPFFSIVHTGNLSSERPVLPLLAVLRRLVSDTPSLLGKIHFWQVGTVDRTVMKQLQSFPPGIHPHLVPPVPLRKALAFQAGADLLLSISGGVENTPAKIYQYLRTGRPILSLAGERANTWRHLMEMAGTGLWCDEKNPAEASAFMEKLVKRGRRSAPGFDPKLLAYSNRALTGKLAAVLDQVCNPSLFRSGNSAHQPAYRRHPGGSAGGGRGQ